MNGINRFMKHNVLYADMFIHLLVEFQISIKETCSP